MARGDVISDWEVTFGGATTFSLQPASGVEWLLHGIYVTTGVTMGNAMMYPMTTDSNMAFQLQAGNTTEYEASSFQVLSTMSWAGGARLAMTNSNFLRLRNNHTDAAVFCYTGFQTK